MPESISLDKANPLLPAEDFAELRRKGFRYIEQSGSAIWTDYNESDPGITLLEALCYAITDLSYRTGFEIKDLLTPEKLSGDTWKEIFYTARKILHNSPLTINDYRKLIIDVEGVRNAWIEKSKNYEVPVWIDYNFPGKRKDEDCCCEEAVEKTCYGKLGLDAIDTATYRQAFLDRLTTLKTTPDNPNASEEEKAAHQAQIKYLEWQLTQLPADSAKLLASKIVEFEGLYNVLIEYEEATLQKDQREGVRQQVLDRLNRNRGLCEDFVSVNAVEYEDTGIRASVVLEEYADPDVVLAQIFFVIYKYFTPSIPFYTIEQMMQKGFLVDELFEGPPLKHGFIDEADLEKTDLFRDIHLSDIISEMADIKGLKAVTYLHLPNEDAANTPGKGFFNYWVNNLRNERKVARIIPEKSLVIFCKQRELISYNAGRPEDRRPERMLKLFRDLKTQESRYKLSGHQVDFPVPAGEYMNLEDFYPVTYTLPMCYGVSERAGLPSDADDKRKAQALQLKGYLLFFEQILSGYLVQLNHLRDLFSFDDSVKHTSFLQGVYTSASLSETGLKELEDLRVLLVDHEHRGADHWDLVLKDFTAVLQNLLEPPKLFHERRNRWLTHLLARFSEDLSEYESLSQWLTPDNVEERIISDKVRLLKNDEYFKISTQRGKAFDYTQYPVWDSDNVSGAERRVCRLLGIADATRHSLAPSYITIEAIAGEIKAEKKNTVRFLDPGDNETVLLTSADVKDGCCTELLISQILEHAGEWRYFRFVNGAKQRRGKYDKSMGPFWFEVYDGDNANAVLLASSPQFETEEERKAAFEKVKKMQEKVNSNEGLHLVEHLLLRPKLDEVLDEENKPLPVGFLPVCLDKCDAGIGLHEGTELPNFRKKISRTPAAKCYDQLPWVLQYFRLPIAAGAKSILFQEAFPNGDEPLPLKFTRYELLTKRVQDLQEFGSEKINYGFVSNEEEQDDRTKTKYGFIIHGRKGEVLAASDYVFSKRTQKQIEEGRAGAADDIDEAIAALIRYFDYELDLYCAEDPCDNNEDPYSFRTTLVLPCWTRRFRDLTFRNLAEKTIQTELPAHVHTRILWVGVQEMKRFEELYEPWLAEMAQNEMPRYEISNPLIEKLANLKSCSDCDDDCGH